MKLPFLALCGFFPLLLHAQNPLDTIGITALRAQDPTLTGSGITVTQPEAPKLLDSDPDFEVNPATVHQRISLLVYSASNIVALTYPNKLGTESTHADAVASNLYDATLGAAPGLRRVWNYKYNYFYSTVIKAQRPTSARVFNQSFAIGQDQPFDDYIARYHTTVASAIGDGNGVPLVAPGDCYNGIGVAAYQGNSSAGPTSDGRCKPDITAPAGVLQQSSFSTPFVSAAAAILTQAGARQKANAPAAEDSRTIKALLLNGAVKPPGWTHTTTAPLDFTVGAGILNVLNSCNELMGGAHTPVSQVLSSGTAHPPLTSGRSLPAVKGWCYRGIASNASAQGVHHYVVTTTTTAALVATLVWNKPYRQKSINQLSLYLYDPTGALLASSQSTVDNVQQIYLTSLPAGRYDLEVVKTSGRLKAPGVVSASDIYALVWDFSR